VIREKPGAARKREGRQVCFGRRRQDRIARSRARRRTNSLVPNESFEQSAPPGSRRMGLSTWRAPPLSQDRPDDLSRDEFLLNQYRPVTADKFAIRSSHAGLGQ
jgi:hypothetical protein